MSADEARRLRFFLIADARTFLAFALAGVKGGVAEDAEDARRLLAEARANAAVGLILITERLARQVRGEVDGLRREGRRPYVLEIPDLTGPLPPGPSFLERFGALLGVPH